MKERKLTGNDLFEMVKEECRRVLGNVGNKGKKNYGVLYKSKRFGNKWGWYKTGNSQIHTKYVGEVKNGKPNGQGTRTLTDGTKYEGEWKVGKRHGQGTLTVPDLGKYVGEWKNGEMRTGIFYDNNGNIEGKMLNGKGIEQ